MQYDPIFMKFKNMQNQTICCLRTHIHEVPHKEKKSHGKTSSRQRHLWGGEEEKRDQEMHRKGFQELVISISQVGSQFLNIFIRGKGKQCTSFEHKIQGGGQDTWVSR